MDLLDAFSLKSHTGEYATWPMVSELLQDGTPTGKRISGYVLEAQYRCGDQYLFVTSWDCPFEESLEIILTDERFNPVDCKSIGAMYTSTWLEHHEPVGERQLLLHCDNHVQIRVTIETTLKLEQKPADSLVFTAYPALSDVTGKQMKTPWWRFW